MGRRLRGEVEGILTLLCVTATDSNRPMPDATTVSWSSFSFVLISVIVLVSNNIMILLGIYPRYGCSFGKA